MLSLLKSPEFPHKLTRRGQDRCPALLWTGVAEWWGSRQSAERGRTGQAGRAHLTVWGGRYREFKKGNTLCHLSFPAPLNTAGGQSIKPGAKQNQLKLPDSQHSCCSVQSGTQKQRNNRVSRILLRINRNCILSTTLRIGGRIGGMVLISDTIGHQDPLGFTVTMTLGMSPGNVTMENVDLFPGVSSEKI